MAPQQIYDIPLDQITIDDANVRHSGAETDLQELADSIKKHGLLQPVVLRGWEGHPPYELIIGQRRFLAHKNILKVKTIKATFAGKLTDEQVAIRSLAENMCRRELSYKDAADAITALYKHFRHDAPRVSKETGLSLRKVNQYVYIEERATSKTKRQLHEGKVTPADVQRAIRAASEDIDKADKLLDLMKKYELPMPAKKRMVEYGQENPSATAEEIVEKAREPIAERAFLVQLTDSERKALEGAAASMKMEPDEVATRAVREWLSAKGFMG